MAFNLPSSNLTGLAVITQPGGLTKTAENFLSLYDYAMQYQPHLIKELHYANGKGSITGLLSILGNEGVYASDVVKHAEMNRLHNRITNVTVNVSTNTFTSPTAHNLQPNMVILISDGTVELQAVVDSVVSSTVFVAYNTQTGAFPFTTSVDISVDFSNTWNKGTGTFESGNTWNPKFYENFSQIIKWRYDVSGSDKEHDIWFDTPDGPRWTNTEIERSNTLFDNMIELTHFFNHRIEAGSAAALAGYPQGMKGVIQQIEERGNVANDYISTVADLEEIAMRAVEQGADVSEYFFFCNMEQMNKFNDLMAHVSPGAGNLPNYGAFNNDNEMALSLDFSSVKVSGFTFHFKPWLLLNNPTILAGGKFDTTGIAYIGVPAGRKSVKDESGKVGKKPYLQILYRANRRRIVQVFGPGGTPQLVDKQTISYLSETTNQVVGANAWFVGRKTAGYYP